MGIQPFPLRFHAHIASFCLRVQEETVIGHDPTGSPSNLGTSESFSSARVSPVRALGNKLAMPTKVMEGMRLPPSARVCGSWIHLYCFAAHK